MSRPPQNTTSLEQSLQICESLPAAPPGRLHARGLNDWPDDELRHVYRELQRLARRRVDNTNDVEDLVQETFLTMLEKYPENELRKGLKIWGLGILRNKIGNYYKKSRREGSVRDLSDRKPCRGSPALPDSEVRYRDLRLLLRRLISDFDPAAKAVMELFFDGLKAAEISSFMQPQLYQTVVSKLHRGRRTLVRRLTRIGYGPENRE